MHLLGDYKRIRRYSRGGDTQQNARNIENNNNALQNVNLFNDHGETINVLTVADIALATVILVPEELVQRYCWLDHLLENLEEQHL